MRKSGYDPLSTVLQNETSVEVPTRAELKATNILFQLDTLLALTLFILNSVARPRCLSRILIFTHPGSRISDPKTATKERDEKNLLS
jgi:hypothetical protein